MQGLIILLFLYFTPLMVTGKWTLDVSLVQYTNTYHVHNPSINSYCCCPDDSNCQPLIDETQCSNDCGGVLFMCLYQKNACTGNTSYLSLSSDNVTFSNLSLQFISKSFQPTKGIFKIYAYKDESWQKQIDIININLISHTPVKQVFSSNTQILLNYHLHCTTNYYGEDCKVYCKPNNTIGHYKCDINGTEICLEGYSKDSNCTKALCLNGCNAIGGHCISPNVCECYSGWTSHNCSTPVCSNDCLHGYCYEPDYCLCKDGWRGDNCSQPLCSHICVYGQCSSLDNCTCFGGWFGDNCSQPVCMEDCDHINGYCIQPGECLCKSGWNGVYCNVSKYNTETKSDHYQLTVNSKFITLTPTLLFLNNKNESDIFKWQDSTYVLATLLVFCLTMIIILLVLFTLSLKRKLSKCNKENRKNQFVIHNPHEAKSRNDLKLIVYDSISLNDGQVKENGHFPPIAKKAESQKLCLSTYNVLTHCGSFNKRSNNITPSNAHKYDVVLPIDEDTSTSTINTPADEDTHQYNKLFMFSEERQSEDTTSAYASKLLTGQQLIIENSSIPDDKVHVPTLVTAVTTTSYDTIQPLSTGHFVSASSTDEVIQHEYDILAESSENNIDENTIGAYSVIRADCM